MTRPSPAARWLSLFAALVLSPSASAQSTTVTVRVLDSAGRPSDGTVTFRGAVTATCRTVAGRCQAAVPPGTWTVTVAPAREAAPAPRTIAVRAGTRPTITLRTVPSQRATVQARPQAAVAARSASPTGASSSSPGVSAVQARPVAASGTTPRVRPQAASAVQTQAARTAVRTTVRRPPPATATEAPAAARPSTAGAVATTQARPTAAARSSAARDLTRGRRLSAQATIVDAQGRPTDATLTVRQGGRVVGTARSVAGRVALYDLAPGTYDVTARFARSGRTQQRRVTVGAAAARFTFRDR